MAKHNALIHTGSSGSNNSKPISVNLSKPMAQFKNMTIPDSFICKVLVKKLKNQKKQKKQKSKKRAKKSIKITLKSIKKDIKALKKSKKTIKKI